MVKRAIKPSYFQDFRELASIRVEKKKDDEDIHLHGLSNTTGWRILREYIDNLIKDLDLMVVTLMENGADFDTIGQRTVAKEIAKELLTKVKNKVEDARETIESEPGGVGE